MPRNGSRIAYNAFPGACTRIYNQKAKMNALKSIFAVYQRSACLGALHGLFAAVLRGLNDIVSAGSNYHGRAQTAQQFHDQPKTLRAVKFLRRGFLFFRASLVFAESDGFVAKIIKQTNASRASTSSA